MKRIISLIICIAFFTQCFSQKTTGLNPAFKIVDPNDQYNRLYGFINETGKTVIPFTYEEAFDFNEGFSRVVKNGKYGFVDEEGKLVINCEYNYAEDFKNGYAKVTKDHKTFYIDAKGVIENNTPVSANLIKIEVNERIGFTDKNGDVIIPADYTSFEIKNNYIVCRNGNMYAVFDATGKKLFETGNSITDVKNNYFLFYSNYKYGVMDISGNVLFETKESINHFFGDYFYTENKSIKTYYDNKGNTIPKPVNTSEAATIDSEISNGSYFANIYDKSGKKIKSYEYDPGVEGDDLKFINGLARIYLIINDKYSKNKDIQQWGGVQATYINTKGEIVWKSEVFYSCFPGDALISMADGTQKKISEIIEGDQILSYDFGSNQKSVTVVENLIVHQNEFYLHEITAVNSQSNFASLNNYFSTEFKLIATPNHPVFTKSGVKTVNSLNESDEIITLDQNGNPISGKIIWNESLSEKVNTVYNLKTKSNCYFVNGILVMMK